VRGSAKRGANRDFARPLRNGKRHHRVDARRREQQHAHRQQPDAPCEVAPEGATLHVKVRQRYDTPQLQRGIDLGANRPKAIDESGRNAALEPHGNRERIDVSGRGGMIDSWRALRAGLGRETREVADDPDDPVRSIGTSPRPLKWRDVTELGAQRIVGGQPLLDEAAVDDNSVCRAEIR
jgi:hypothetical protein